MTRHLLALFTVLAAAVIYATPASAYIGPGTGLSAIGALLALIAALAVAVVGFLWFPIKRLISGKKTKAPVASKEAGE